MKNKRPTSDDDRRRYRSVGMSRESDLEIAHQSTAGSCRHVDVALALRTG
jgi:hypothetical protein